MASYPHLGKHSNLEIESPAKVFSRLKTKVHRGGACANNGVATRSDPPCSVQGNHGGSFMSPRKTSRSAEEGHPTDRHGYGSRDEAKTWTISPIPSPQKKVGCWDVPSSRADDKPLVSGGGRQHSPTRGAFLESTAFPQAQFTVNRRQIHPESARVTTDRHGYGSRDEAKTWTISPIPSPQKKVGCWDVPSSRADDKPLVSGGGRQHSPTRGAFLESTAFPQAQFTVNRRQIHPESARVRQVAGFNAGSKTPVKSLGKDCVFKKEQTFQISPSSGFSPIKNRLRKRQIEPRDFNDVSSSTKIHDDARSQPQENQTSGGGCVVMEKLVHRPGVSAGPPDISHFPQGPLIPPMAKRYQNSDCSVLLEKCPMSPAKMFAYMKTREGRAAHRACNSMGNPFHGNGVHQSGDTPPPEAHTVTEENTDAECVVPVCQSSTETVDSQSAVDPSEDVRTCGVFSQPVLLEDPLILNSPRVTIPRMNTLKQNCPQPSKVPSEKMILLKEWYLKHNKKGLYVEGIHREENILWNSNVIAERVSPYVVKTITGRIYVLNGKMNMPVNSNFTRCFLKKFRNGFPPNWSKMYEEFLSQSNKGTEKGNEKRGDKAKSKASIDLSSKNPRKNVFKTPDACPPSSSSTKMSRSGRIIKPPLEYWKGGRVILDAHMNVTIHECYEKSICNPEDTAAMSTRILQESLFPGRHCDKAALAPQRNVKAPSRRRNKGKSNRGEKPSHSPDSSVEFSSISAKGTSRWGRSSQSCQTKESVLQMDPDPQWNAAKMQGSTRKQTVPPSRASPDINNMSPEQSSDSAVKVRRKKRSSRQHKKRGEDSPQLQHFAESRIEVRKTGKVEKEENKKASEPTTLKSSTSSKKPKRHKGSAQILAEEDGDKWKEEELAMLQEAVARYPKHKANYWAEVARIVGKRSAEECYNQYTFQGTPQSPVTKVKKREKQLDAPKDPGNPVISARVGTLKRKQQVRHFLETMPKENVDDVFSCSYMQKKRIEIPSTYESNLSDDPEITLRSLEPMTPMSTGFPEVKTPQCLHITPGMMGSPNRSNDDKYVFQLQKRMKKRQFNVCKKAPPEKSFAPTPSVKRTMRKCDNAGQDTFVVREMFPGNQRVSDSEEEEDYYFSDHNCT